MMIVGPPGAGKSHLISQLLGRKDLYGEKFDRIFYFGPTKYEGLEQDEDNTSLNVQ
jgi:adenylate kinase family enzyme